MALETISVLQIQSLKSFFCSRLSGLRGQIEGLEFALSKMSAGEDLQNLMAERDELLQKLQNEAAERERVVQERDADADELAQLKDSLAKVGLSSALIVKWLLLCQTQIQL